MNKAELVEEIRDDFDSKAAAERAVKSVIRGIQAGLVGSDGKVQLIGFGTFDVRERAARTGRNPQTGKPIQIPASKTVRFRPGKNLKEAVND